MSRRKDPTELSNPNQIGTAHDLRAKIEINLGQLHAQSAAERVANQWYDRYFHEKGANPFEKWPVDTLERLKRQHFAKLDDAILALERAENALSGKTHSSLWWRRLHTLRLAIYAAHLKLQDGEMRRTLAFRTRRDKLKSIQRAYINGRATSSLDQRYFQLRLAEYAYRACERLPEADKRVAEFQGELTKVLQSNISGPHCISQREDLVDDYANKLIAEFERIQVRI